MPKQRREKTQINKIGDFIIRDMTTNTNKIQIIIKEYFENFNWKI
jgi:hypothetical protein